ncbi:MAG: nicotinamide mononucleotide transporter [Candidatus Gastranaerophilales bacterium]|nr:nicotinamide mononucleotide transporter [Candidatus Gastranaerophilales bacterium]
MKIKDFLIREFKGFSLFEKIFFPLEILLIIFISILMNDSKVALVSAIAGISYTILAGKGKILCYFIGLTGTFCYCYISFKNALYGNLALYGLYFFPMQVLGIIKWAKHLKKDTGDVIKTSLTNKQRLLYFLSLSFLTIIFGYILQLIGGKTPYIDAITVVFSIFGQLLTVKRCIEQWYVWFVVNVLSLIMWIIAYQNGSNCFATIIMWATYVFLALYFLFQWKKEIAISNEENI